MMSKDDGFQRQKWDKQLTRTEIPRAQLNESVSETQLTTSAAPDAGGGKMMLWLIVSSPSENRGTVLPVSDGSLIGRHGDIRWHDARMSRKHAQFTLVTDLQHPDRKIFAITPHNDRNGTMVNGRKISGTTLLEENDIIIMGDTRFVVKVLE